MAYQVFIKGVTQPGTEATVAKAIAERYGLAQDAIEARLKSGQFRVKAGVERPEAETFVSELVALGARAMALGPDGQIPAPDENAQTPRPSAVSTSPLPAKQSTESESDGLRLSAQLPAQPTPREPVGDYQSGLAAAFSGDTVEQELGALGGGDSAFSLSSVDGTSGAEPAAMAAKKSPAQPGAMTDDAFLPPEAESEDLVLSVELPPKPETPTAATGTSAEIAEPRLSAAQMAAAGIEVAEPKNSSRTRLAGYLSVRPRAIVVTAVMFGILFGFLPAFGFSYFGEASAFGSADKNLREAYSDVKESGGWDDLPDEIAAAKAKLKSSRRTTSIISILIWLVCAAGLAFLWARLLPWYRWAEPA